jgi:hypothetical protein
LPYVPNSSWANNSTGGTPLSADRLNNMEAGIAWTWETWTPEWTCESGTQPSIGNGTLSGRFVKRGTNVHAFVYLVAGSSTDFGNGGLWVFSLPFTASGWPLSGVVRMYENAADSYPGNAYLLTTTTFTPVAWFADNGGAFVTQAFITNAAPFAWGTSDIFEVMFTYETAE